MAVKNRSINSFIVDDWKICNRFIMSLYKILKNKENTLGNTGYNKITDLLQFWLCFTPKVSERIYNYEFDKKCNCQNLVQ